MSYDLNILVLEQERPSKFHFITRINIKNEYQEKLRYCHKWKYVTGMKGIWYSMGIYDAEFDMFTNYPLCYSDFKIKDPARMPYWIKDEDIQYSLTPLIIHDEYKEEFKKILEYLLSQSPINKIIFSGAYQGGEKEIICGLLSYSEFITMLENQEILFNVSYIIGD